MRSQKPDKPHYQKSRYWSHLRVHGYANQLLELDRLAPETVLEVGRADGFLSAVVPTFTRHRLISCDVDPALGPDVAASVLGLPFQAASFDVVLCCQVLEHLPFTEFGVALSELRRVARRAIILSLPDVRRYAAVRVRLPKAGWRTYSLSPERHSLGPYQFDGEHHWEIGFRGTRFHDVRRAVERSGVTIVRWYRLPELPYHCYFILDPNR